MAPPVARTFYEVLDVDRKAPKVDIRVAYHRLALQLHPDKNHGARNAVTDFQELVQAYEVLSDDKRRILYDKKLPKELPVPFMDTKDKAPARNAFREANKMFHETSEMLRTEREKLKAAQRKREQDARESERKIEAENKRKEREALEKAAMEAESARARVAETVRRETVRREKETREKETREEENREKEIRENETREKETRESEIEAKEAEKIKKAKEEEERAANDAKSNVTKAEQEWILGIEKKIKAILTMKSNLHKLEDFIWLLEQRDFEISNAERRVEERARNSTTVWERSPEGLEKEHARSRKNRLMQIMGKKLGLEQDRKELKNTEAEYALQLIQESQTRRQAARRIEVEMKRDMDGTAQQESRQKEEDNEKTEMQERLPKRRETERQESDKAEREHEEMMRQRQRMSDERKEQWEKMMRLLEAKEKERKEQEVARKVADQQKKERELQQRRLEELNKQKMNAHHTQHATVNKSNGAAYENTMSVVDEWEPAPAMRATWKKYGRCHAITQRGSQCTKTLNCNLHRCEDPVCEIPWNHTTHDGSVGIVSKTLT